jgi:leucine-rich repeat protein SHOC2
MWLINIVWVFRDMKQVDLEKIIQKAKSNKWQRLSLNSKQIDTLPENTTDLPYLIYLNLAGNEFNIFPSNITNLLNLRELVLSSNLLSELPDNISKLTHLKRLELYGNKIDKLPKNIDYLTRLKQLNLGDNCLNNLPESIGELSNLAELSVSKNKLHSLPESIGNLSKLYWLSLDRNLLTSLPESIGNLSRLIRLDLSFNQLSILPETIGSLFNLKNLWLNGNQITKLPNSFINLTNLTELHLEDNPLNDLSVLKHLPDLKMVYFLNVFLSRRYFTKFSDWKAEWLLDEDNAEVRRVLIEQLGYERICKELNAINLDNWREYTLLKIDGIEAVYSEYHEEIIDREPMLLLKMTCPSTQHIHILRVPPEMTSAEAAITWVNHGIHPDKFAVQT